MKNIIGCTVIAVLTFFLFAFQQKDKIKGWFLAGSQPDAYEIGIENNSDRNGKVAYLTSVKRPEHGKFGTIMQSFNPEDYKGKRVRLSGYLKSQDVSNWAGMWFRVDGPIYGVSLAFDNMQERAIKGTTAWQKYETVLDVPQNATAIAYGVLLSGPGTVWIDSLNFEVVGSDVPVTKPLLQAGTVVRPGKPVNTNFEEAN